MRWAGIVATMAFVGLLASAGPARAESGAFAYDSNTGKYGFSWNQRDQQQADTAALKGCAADNCKVVFRTGPKECGAIAMSDNGKVWGGAKRDERAAADLAAIENCQKRTSGQCKVRGSECNR